MGKTIHNITRNTAVLFYRTIGTQQGERRVIENLLRVRFGAIVDRLNTVIDAVLTLTPEEFTLLLLHLSQEELIDRFGTSS